MKNQNLRNSTSGKVHTPYGAVFYRLYRPITFSKKKTLVCLHGNSIDGSVFEKLSQQLPYYKVIVLDALGHGQSDVASSEEMARKVYCFEGMAIVYWSAIEQILENKEECFTILGLSKGGHEAIQMCNVSNHPEFIIKRIESLIITGTPPLCFNKNQGNLMKQAFLESKALSYCGHLQQFTNEEAHAFIGGYDFLDEEAFKKFVEIAKKTDGRARRYMLDNVSSLSTANDEVKILKSFKIPVLIIGGKSDLFINYDYVSKEFSSSSSSFNKHITFELIENEGNYRNNK